MAMVMVVVVLLLRVVVMLMLKVVVLLVVLWLWLWLILEMLVLVVRMRVGVVLVEVELLVVVVGRVVHVGWVVLGDWVGQLGVEVLLLLLLLVGRLVEVVQRRRALQVGRRRANHLDRLRLLLLLLRAARILRPRAPSSPLLRRRRAVSRLARPTTIVLDAHGAGRLAVGGATSASGAAQRLEVGLLVALVAGVCQVSSMDEDG